MANVILTENAWADLEDRSIEIFATNRNVNLDEALLIALVERRDPDLTCRALLLMESDTRISFSLAFRITRETDRQFAEPLPFNDSAMIMPALAPALQLAA